MEINTLGSFLRYYREKNSFLQEKVCSGICSSSVLSKIESGMKIADSLEAEFLLGRIGKEVLQFELLLNDKDYDLWNLREKISEAESEEDYKKVKRFLEMYMEEMPLDKSVHMQFYFYHKAQIRIAEGALSEEICELLYKALQLTKPEMDSGNEENLLYNPLEIKIIVQLIHYQYTGWKHKNKEFELLKLLEYVQKIYSGRQKEITGTQILLELINVEQDLGDYLRVVKYADKAIDLIVQGRSMENIADLHFIKAKALEKMYHDSEEWNVQEEKCKEECLMAYYVFQFLEQKEEVEKVQKFCKEKLGWQIIE